MSYTLGPRSRANLAGVHPDLVRVVEHAIQITRQDFFVVEGVRTPERQSELYAQGRTAPGPVVTWTKTSRHFRGVDGYGRAVDLVPWPIDWNTPAKFDAIYAAMMAAAEEAGVAVRSGMDWDGDGNPRERGESDSPHFELGWGG